MSATDQATGKTARFALEKHPRRPLEGGNMQLVRADHVRTITDILQDDIFTLTVLPDGRTQRFMHRDPEEFKTALAIVPRSEAYERTL